MIAIYVIGLYKCILIDSIFNTCEMYLMCIQTCEIKMKVMSAYLKDCKLAYSYFSCFFYISSYFFQFRPKSKKISYFVTLSDVRLQASNHHQQL